MKSYFNSQIDRLDPIQYNKLFQRNPQTFQFHKDEYIKLEILGNGSSSWVYLIYHIEHEKLYALKIFNNSDESEKVFERELYNYNNLIHPLFPRFFGTSQEDECKCLVVEYIEGESLDNFKEINILIRVQMTIDILTIIEYIHNNKFIYRDFKINNFIVNKDRDIFLIDFDRMIDLETINESNEITNDFINIPPEIKNFGKFSYSSDIYFFAKNVLKHLFPDGTMEESDEIIKKCTNENPELRLNIFQLISEYYYILGEFYEGGDGVKQDYNIAKKYYEFSAKQNNSNALFRLGLFYYNGNGVKQDYRKAKEYFKLSAKQNNSDALSMLGYHYCIGSGVKQDYFKSIKYFKLSAQQNNSYGLYYIGIFYKNGFGMEKDYNKASEYFELSANLNNSSAMVKLGDLYQNGI